MTDKFFESLLATLAQREQDYGPPDESHELIAEAWTWWLRAAAPRDGIRPMDVAAMMMLLKMARLAHGPTPEARRDSILDLAGYAAVLARLDDDNT